MRSIIGIQLNQQVALRIVSSLFLLVAINLKAQEKHKSNYYIKFSFEKHVNEITMNKTVKISKSLSASEDKFTFYVEYTDGQHMTVDCRNPKTFDSAAVELLLSNSKSNDFVRFETRSVKQELQKPNDYEYYLIEFLGENLYNLYKVERMFWQGRIVE